MIARIRMWLHRHLTPAGRQLARRLREIARS